MSLPQKKPLIIVTGPTASGKSGVGVELALKLNTSVISADSVQIYKGMDIGSAKITAEEMKGVKHYLISELEPDALFNVSEFVSMARPVINSMHEAGKTPVMVGGTAFYIQALLKGVEFDEATGADDIFRRDCEELLKEPDKEKWEELFNKHFDGRNIFIRDSGRGGEEPAKPGENKNTEPAPEEIYAGTGTLYEMLKLTDPVYAQIVHANNNKRVIRALEYCKATGERFSDYNKREAARESDYDFFYYVLEDDRADLYDRINKRVDEMMEAGLEDEVRRLLAAGYGSELKSMQSIGYKEMISYIEGRCSLDAAVEAIKQNTRHFAKRQITWFRRERDVIPVDIRKYDYDALRIAEMIISDCFN